MAVVRYLWSRGVSKEKLETVAMGDAHPLASNGSADGKKKNRRVEIFVIRR
jgi:outer membrane protein OmpA-like peptidoglycan-associated protein